jgi:atypical dual specificity phosphatase
MDIPALRPAEKAASAFMGPKDFHWLVRGRLGGTPRPGVGFGKDLHGDLEALRRVNTCLLINLTEESDPPLHVLEEAGLESYHHKIPDMGAPELADALATCRVVDRYLSEDKVCVFHCHAGKGRTGTMLAAQLIFYGMDADQAVTKAREQNPKWIESQRQIDFLRMFADYVPRHATIEG